MSWGLNPPNPRQFNHCIYLLCMLNIFADIGRVVSGYRVRDGKWTEIGQKNPQLPQVMATCFNVPTAVRPAFTESITHLTLDDTKFSMHSRR